MMNPDWIELWNKVAAAAPRTPERQKVNKGKRHFRRDSPARPDPLLDFVLQHIKEKHTFLDIGAGNGRWTIPVAGTASGVTALEPSGPMLEMLRENTARAGLDNIRIVQARWEQADVEPHDIVSCTHAAYETTDFAGFIRKMENTAREMCCLVLRLPPHDGITGELCREIYGHPFDSPNAILGCNALYSMGIYPNVMVEEEMHRWKDPSLDDAFARAKRHLNLESSTEYDDLIRETLEKRLTFSEGAYIWPDGMRGVLLWWKPRN